MKRSLLATGLIACAALSTNAQTSTITGTYAVDLFTDTAQVWTESEMGIYWFDGDVAGMYGLTRNADDMVLEVANDIKFMDGCADDGSCVYNPFGFVFGNDTITDDPFSVDLSGAGAAVITLVVENTSADTALRITAQMKDANDAQAEILYDDTTQVSAADLYEWKTWRWKKAQRTVAAGATDTIVFDFNNAFTLAAGNAWTCEYPVNCPKVADEFDFSQVTTVLFMVNAGAGSPNEKHTDAEGAEVNTVIDGFSEVLKIHSMTLGIPEVIDNVEELTQNVQGISVSPNPATNSARFAYNLTENTDVQLAVFDALGRQVDVLVDANQAAGTYNINYDVTNRNEGVYFYVLRAGNDTVTKKLIVNKK